MTRKILIWKDLGWKVSSTRYMGFLSFLTTVWPGLRVAQIWLIFAVPAHLCQPHIPSHLAYIEWFTHFCSPDPDSHLHSISHSYHNNSPVAEIIPITAIVSSCYLTPKFGTKYHPARWDTLNILEECKSFYLTKHINLDTFLCLEGHFPNTWLVILRFFFTNDLWLTFYTVILKFFCLEPPWN